MAVNTAVEESKDARDMDDHVIKKNVSDDTIIEIGHKNDDVVCVPGDDKGDTCSDDTSTVKLGIFSIFQFADTTDKLCIAFAVFCSAISGANQVYYTVFCYIQLIQVFSFCL